MLQDQSLMDIKPIDMFYKVVEATRESFNELL